MSDLHQESTLALTEPQTNDNLWKTKQLVKKQEAEKEMRACVHVCARARASTQGSADLPFASIFMTLLSHRPFTLPHVGSVHRKIFTVAARLAQGTQAPHRLPSGSCLFRFLLPRLRSLCFCQSIPLPALISFYPLLPRSPMFTFSPFAYNFVSSWPLCTRRRLRI